MSQSIQIGELSEDHVRAMMRWSYDDPYSLYNLESPDIENSIRFFRDPANGYFSITGASGELLGFCNFGYDARVPGGNYRKNALDVGMGMRPDLTGKGLGSDYAKAVFDFGRQQYAPEILRVTIAAFNKRAQRLCERFGFRQIGRFEQPKTGRPFVIMILVEPDL